MIVNAKVVCCDDDNYLALRIDDNISREIAKKKVENVGIIVEDGRNITVQQRKKIFATINDIADWQGDDPEILRMMLTAWFCEYSDTPKFSLSDVDMTTANNFIDFLINLCFEQNIPTRDTLLSRTGDINRYLYMCLEHRKCVICNAPADVHHIDTVGMGRDRNKINHLGLMAMALCRKHHTVIHTIGTETFFNKHHVYGIKLDEYLCKKLNLNYKEKNNG